MEWLMGIVAATVAFFATFLAAAQPGLPYPLFVQPPQATVLVGGDLMFDRTIRLAMEEHGTDHPLSCIVETLSAADLAMANLEGPITSNPSVSVGSEVGGTGNFTFTFPTSTAAMLYRNHIRVVNLGNNHIMHFSRDGLLETKEWLDRAGVQYFGDPDVGESERVLRIMLRGVPLSFVNWSDWTSDKTDHTVAQVRTEAEAGRVVIVYTHWGEEYVPATDRMKRLAHDFVDAGADIVIGSHPHIVQEHEVYEGAHIYYSLGNFVFDQYWNEDVRTGLLLRLAVDQGGVQRVEEIPIELLRDRRTCPAGQL
jgi:poly-gamma-glutamate synthesis protein (capsule biosynthesis protein)